MIDVPKPDVRQKTIPEEVKTMVPIRPIILLNPSRGRINQDFLKHILAIIKKEVTNHLVTPIVPDLTRNALPKINI